MAENTNSAKYVHPAISYKRSHNHYSLKCFRKVDLNYASCHLR